MDTMLSSLFARLASLCLYACLLGGLITLASCSSRPSSSNNRPNPVPGILQAVSTLITSGKLREAEILLTRSLQTDGENLIIWQEMLSLQLQITAQESRSLSGSPLLRGNALLEAGETLERARSTLNGIRGLSIAPGSKVDPKTVVESEALFGRAQDRFKSKLQVFCKERIDEANDWRYKAHHWYKPNKRSLVVKGVEQVRLVLQFKSRLEAWSEADICGSAATALSELKALVKEDEWTDILARAGFNPGSIPFPK